MTLWVSSPEFQKETGSDKAERLAEQNIDERREAKQKADEDRQAATAAEAKRTAEATAKIPSYLTFRYGPDATNDLRNRFGGSIADKINVLGRGAALATAYSDQCDSINGADIGDKATRNDLYWTVDCNNQNRFIVGEQQAQVALRREKNPAASILLQMPLITPSCTWNDLPNCSRNAPHAGAPGNNKKT